MEAGSHGEGLSEAPAQLAAGTPGLLYGSLLLSSCLVPNYAEWCVGFSQNQC